MNNPTYKCIMLDEGNNIIKTVEEVTDIPFKTWKHTKVLDFMKPRGQRLLFFIDDIQQFLNC